MNTQIPRKITLEDITQRKAKLLVEMNNQKKRMTATARDIFAPIAPAANQTEAIMRSFNTGMAVFDGIMTGVKIMRKVRNYFRSLK